jgi:uncharacterized protein
MKTFLFRYLFVCVMLLGFVSLASAQNLPEIRARMEKRVPQVDELKASGVLGENNLGFLAVRSGDDQGVAAAENADRSVVYAAIAKKTGSTADMVGKTRAQQIAENSAAGVYLQRVDGGWYKIPTTSKLSDVFVKIGMQKTLVRELAGVPMNETRTTFQNLLSETWHYSNGLVLFENGRVKAVQISK